MLAGYLIGIVPWGYAIHYRRSDFLTKFSWTIAFILSPIAASFLYFRGAWVPRNTWKFIRGSSSLKKAQDVDLNLTTGSSIEPIFNINILYNTLIKEILAAKEFIHIQYFIISDGIIWKKIKESLLKKKKEGVKIIIVTDFIGNVWTPDEAYEEIKEAGIQFYEFGEQNLLVPSGQMNFRTHNKFVIIDNKIAFIGGANIGDNYASLTPKYGSWFDLAFLIKGELIGNLANEFYSQLSILTNESYSFVKTAPIDEKITAFVEADGPNIDEPVFLNRLLSYILQAKHTVKIVTPYYIIPQILNDELAKAVKRGVNVEIIISGKYDKKLPHQIGSYFVEDSISKGIKFFRTNNIFTHTKMYLFDDSQMIIGTSNLDYRAIYYNYETNIYVKDEILFTKLNKEFEIYKANSYKETSSSKNWGIIKTSWSKVIKLLSPIL